MTDVRHDYPIEAILSLMVPSRQTIVKLSTLVTIFFIDLLFAVSDWREHWLFILQLLLDHMQANFHWPFLIELCTLLSIDLTISSNHQTQIL